MHPCLVPLVARAVPMCVPPAPNPVRCLPQERGWQRWDLQAHLAQGWALGGAGMLCLLPAALALAWGAVLWVVVGPVPPAGEAAGLAGS